MGKRILIASPVNQKEDIFKEYLNSLRKLIVPNEIEINYYFILHNCDNLIKYLNNNEKYDILNDNISLIKEKNKQKQWTTENYKKVAEMRSSILKKAREEKYDYLFMVDSDVLLHPKTLILLLQDNKDIVGHLSWTKLSSQGELKANCGAYEGWGTYNINEIKYPNLYKVGWTGRTTLISSKVFNNPNIDYKQILGVDNTGSEDYAFCLKAYCNIPDLEIYFDTRLPSRHLYQEKDYERWMKEKSIYEI